MNNIPVEISLDIFYRVPADAVLECKRVCKTWRDLLSTDKTNFAVMHLSRHGHNHHDNSIGSSSSKVRLGLIFLIRSVKPKSAYHPLYYGEFDENTMTDQNDQRIENILRPINHPLLKTCQKDGLSALVGSCNGLICLVETTGIVKDPVHIYNPVTRECLRLPGFIKDSHRIVTTIHSGFGYCSGTNEYKVVRILESYFPHRTDVQVYTLGAGSGWRNKGVMTAWLSSLRSVFFNGALHWFQRFGNNIMVFDLSDETFRVIQGPFPDRGHMRTYILRSFGEWLCVAGVDDRKPSTGLAIWTYKKSISVTDNKDESWIWCKEFSISAPEISSTSWRYKPFALTKSGLVILEYVDENRHKSSRCDARTLFCYNPTTAAMKPLGVWNFFDAIPHTNSFVSLKALGETTCKKRKRSPTSSTDCQILTSLMPNT